ncbi:hypothetical protein F511_16253 [Dorcoceras hygrometricum]|uniref:Uncharacterized protein n=1 Tax=Dorcoceras hygrometricum TaxID=472368 RepID=A0A2Z7BIG4_9LAMI|nr:hypothetical protein F511_16253 [Dorcoceras hygrometricum]
MERSEPALVPEWLKSTGNLTSGGNTTANSGDHTAIKFVRNKSFVNGNGHDLGRSSNSSYFHRSFNSNSPGHPRSYNSFGRSQRDKGWEKDTYDSRGIEKSSLGNRQYQDSSALSIKFERDESRRSQSMSSGKHGDMWHKKAPNDVSNSHGNSNNGVLTKGNPVGTEKKATFERDFPSLGAEERSVPPEVGRVPSPGVSTAIQSLPISSATIRGDKWTSALAEVPMLVGSNGASLTSVQQASAGPVSISSGSCTSLNMAEAVAQAPHRSQSTSQSFAGTQRLEELAIKQSRQLIPVTPSMPKIAVSASERHKNKAGQQQYPVSSPLPSSNSPRTVKDDILKASNVGKLHVLKSARERNGVNPIVKENTSPTSGINAASSTVFAGLSGSASAVTRSPPSNPVAPNTDRKPVLTVLEKLPTSQARSRKDFFNLMKMKSMTNSSPVADSRTTTSSAVPDACTAVSPSSSDKLDPTEIILAPSTALAGDTPYNLSHGTNNHLSGEMDVLTCNGYACDNPDPLVPEEEAAFLRSLGWEENSDEGGLTEEEINSFYKDVTKVLNPHPN